ncbi:hypothetical protein BOX15_Mlig025124g1, partial [Macrostomum lignano]
AAQTEAMASGGGKPSLFLKIFLIIVNALFLLVGALVLGVGIYLCTSAELGRFSDVIAAMETLKSIRVILIGCGCVILLVGLFGCSGSCKESSCLLTVYAFLLAILLIANITVAILSFTFSKEVKSFAKDRMAVSMRSLYGNGTDPSGRLFTDAVDNIQREEQCCGWSGLGSPSLFNSTPWFRVINANSSSSSSSGDKIRTFPDSCCALTKGPKYESCAYSTDEKKSREEGIIHEMDCWDRLIDVSGTFIHATIGTVIAAILLQIVCLICAIVLLCQIRRGSDGGIHV